MGKQRKLIAKRQDLCEEVTGYKGLDVQVPIEHCGNFAGELKKPDTELTDKFEYYYSTKMGSDAAKIYDLLLSYLDALCSLDFDLLDAKDKQMVQEVMKTVTNVINADSTHSLTPSRRNNIINAVNDVGHFSLTCFAGSSIPIVLPLVNHAMNYIMSSHMIYKLLKGKDRKHVRDILDFTSAKTIELLK